VVLMAYDFQLLWKEKKHKLLWETRFSIRQRHNDFDRQLRRWRPMRRGISARTPKGDPHAAARGKSHPRQPKVIDVEPEKK